MTKVSIGIEASTVRQNSGTPQLYVPTVYDWGESLPFFRALFSVARRKGVELYFFDRSDIFNKTLSRGSQIPEQIPHDYLRRVLFPSGTPLVNANQLLESGFWRRIVVPLPDVIYNAEIPLSSHEDPRYGDATLLTPPLFPILADDKYLSNVMVREVVKGTEIDVPDFRLYSRLNLEHLITQYKGIFLKPREGRCGKGVLAIRQHSQGYVLIQDENKREQHISLSDAVLSAERHMAAFLSDSKTSSYKSDSYLLQKYVDTYSYEDQQGNKRVCDLRTFTQRGTHGELTYFVAVARIGALGNISSGISTLGYAVPVEHLLDLIYHGDRERVIKTIHTLKNTSFRIHKRFEQETGPIAEATIDYLIDEQGHISFCEINARPGRIDVIDIFGPYSDDGKYHRYFQGTKDQLQASCEALIDYALFVQQQVKPHAHC